LKTPRKELTVIALGGNAILQRGERGTFEEQYRNVQATMSQVADLIVNGVGVVITHGNGPQIGATLIRHEEAKDKVPAFPLYACGAETQGLLGYMIQQALQSELASRGEIRQVATIVTQVEVDRNDPALHNPTKPIGPFLADSERRKLLQERKDLVVREDSGRGYRRVVASPDPKALVESQAIETLVENGTIVIACGGGGIPVAKSGTSLYGVEAVIDKDLAAERLATSVGARRLAILTDVQGIFLGYGTRDQRLLTSVSRGELAGFAEKGEFAAGSMGPKVQAVLRFLANGGESAVIGYLGNLKDAVEGRSGTEVTK
jgi:carbamate kinase